MLNAQPDARQLELHCNQTDNESTTIVLPRMTRNNENGTAHDEPIDLAGLLISAVWRLLYVQRSVVVPLVSVLMFSWGAAIYLRTQRTCAAVAYKTNVSEISLQ